jgi:hypothetical protein
MIFEFIKENRNLFDILEMCETLDKKTYIFRPVLNYAFQCSR